MMICLPLAYPYGWSSVTAEIEDVAPHLSDEWSFAVHRHHLWPDEWNVSCVENGMRVTKTPSRTRKQAIESAKIELAKRTLGDMRAAVKAAPGWTRAA